MSTDLPPARIRTYRAAIALSNIGVGLMERNRFADAMATMKGALEVVRSAFPSNDHECPQDQQSQDEEEMQHRLKEATLRLARPLSLEEKVAQAMSFRLTVLSDDRSPDIVRHAAHNIASTHDAVAIRIDDSKSCDDALSLDVDAAIILLNYGIACRLHADTVSPKCPKRLRQSFRLFNLAFIVLSRRQASEVTQLDDIEAIRLLLIAMIVLQNLMQLSLRLQKPKQAQSFYDKLCRHREVFWTIDRRPRLIEPKKGAAPAA